MPRPRHSLRLGVSLALALLGGAAKAYAIEPDLWGELRLVGGAEAARKVFSLAPQDRRLDAEWLPDFIHRFGQLEAWPPAAQRFSTYVRYLDQVRQAAAAWPSGIRIDGLNESAADRDRLKTFLELIGLRVRDSGGRPGVSVDAAKSSQDHVEWLEAAGVDVRAIAARLNAGQTATIALREAVLPLPLPSFWTTTVFKHAVTPIEDLIADRSWAFLYLGLLSVDDETLGFLARRPALLQSLHDDGPVFGTFAAECFHVRGDRVELPGGAETESIWRGLVGRPSSEPDNFLRELVKRDDGRLSYFYAVVAGLDGPKQTFALGGHLAAKVRPDFVRQAYTSFRAIDLTWNLLWHPFHRPSPDPFLVLTVLDIDAGQTGPGWLVPMLDRIVSNDGWPSKAAEIGRAIRDRPADMRWTVGWVYARRNEAPARFRLLSFAQRHFIRLDRSRLADLDGALRCAWQMPALALALERMGVADPSTYAEMARAAHELTTSAQMDAVVGRLGRWQAAVALLEQVQRRRRLPANRLNGLVSSLAAAATASARGASGTIPGWIAGRLVPEVAPIAIDQLSEPDLVHALVHPPEEADVRVAWEGVTYILDESVAVERDVAAIRAASPSLEIIHVLVLSQLLDRLRNRIASIQDLRKWVSELVLERAAVEHLPLDPGQTRSFLASFDRIADSLGRVEDAKDFRKVEREVQALGELADALTDAGLPPLVYALAVTPLNRAAGVFADTWRQHSLGPLPNQSLRQWRQAVWDLAAAEPRPGGGTTIRGSFLELDLVLSDSRLPRPPSDVKLDEPQVRVLTEALVLPGRPAIAEIERAVTALERGRSLVQDWQTTPPDRGRMRAALTSAAVDSRRANAFAWTLSREPAAAARILTITELVRLGGGRVPEGWGAEMRAIDGCPCVRSLAPTPIDRWRGGWPEGLPAAMTLDLSFRLAEALIRRRLPPGLVDSVRPAATSEWLAHIFPITPDDWQALATWPAELPESRVEAYVLSLVSRGILIAAGSGGRE